MRTGLSIFLHSSATTVSNVWITQKLAMGHPGSVSRSVTEGKANEKLIKDMKKIESVLIRVL